MNILGLQSIQPYSSNKYFNKRDIKSVWHIMIYAQQHFSSFNTTEVVKFGNQLFKECMTLPNTFNKNLPRNRSLCQRTAARESTRLVNCCFQNRRLFDGILVLPETSVYGSTISTKKDSVNYIIQLVVLPTRK